MVAGEAHLKARVEELRRLESRLRLGGGQAKSDKQHQAGKLTARERLERLLARFRAAQKSWLPGPEIRMPERRRLIANRLILLASFVACLVAFYISGSETVRQFSSNIMTTWVNPIPKWWISTCIPVGFLLSALQFLRLGLKRNDPA